MRKNLLIPFIITLLNLHFAYGQHIPADIAGTWLGKLNVGTELRLVFTFEVHNDSIITHFGSPDQGADDIPVSSTVLKGDTLRIVMQYIKADYTGLYDAAAASIKGTFTQNGNVLPLDLVKVDAVEGPRRPQNPAKPYSYKEEEVVFKNTKTDSVNLAGTLTMPQGEGPFKAVVLVTGSGPQNRDEFLLNHSPFWVLSDYLTKNNIIVLRYDDRGIAKSTGDFASATTKDFADDANAAVNYLVQRKKELHISEIGIAGHSEGGIVAPLAATQNKQVDFIVLLAGTGIKGDTLLNLQQRLILESAQIPENIITKYSMMQKEMMHAVETGNNWDSITAALIGLQRDFLRNTPEEELNMVGVTKDDSLNTPVDFYTNDWMKFFLLYDPSETLQKIKIPVLAINGDKDLQVPSNVNLPAIEAALKKAGNKHYTTMVLPGLNHLFQHCDQCTVSEYGELEETFSEDAMKIIADWINQLQ